MGREGIKAERERTWTQDRTGHACLPQRCQENVGMYRKPESSLNARRGRVQQNLKVDCQGGESYSKGAIFAATSAEVQP